jgi:hypothetical protein
VSQLVINLDALLLHHNKTCVDPLYFIDQLLLADRLRLRLEQDRRVAVRDVVIAEIGSRRLVLMETLRPGLDSRRSILTGRY